MRLKYEVDEEITSANDLAAVLLRVNFHVISELDKKDNNDTGINPSVYISVMAFVTFSVMHSLLKTPGDYWGMKKMIKSFFNTFVKSMKHIEGGGYADIMSVYKN